MEVCKGPITTHSRDMGILDAHEISAMRCAHGYNFITMEGSEHIRVGNAKVEDPLICGQLPKAGFVSLRGQC